MASYSIFHTKTHLSELLRQVKAGKEMIVTERGKPIAKICPIIESDQSLESRLEHFEKNGQLLRAKKKDISPEINEVDLDEHAANSPPSSVLNRFLKDR